MKLGDRHTLHRHQSHCGWDHSIEPVLTIAPGTRVTFDVQDASGGQIIPGTGAEAVTTMDPDRINPVTGPVYVDGAMPGDALKITLLEFVPSGWGWTANIPGFGLLADQFPEPALHHWTYATSARVPALFGTIARVPLQPFAGTLGVAPAAEGRHDVIPPRRIGGNMDIRDLIAGSELYLPVEVAGALFSLGDSHAAQGDGEVCGTAIESPMQVSVHIDLVRQMRLETPRYTTPGPVTRHLDGRGYDATTGIGPDLMAGARDSVRRMVDLLASRHGLSAVEAYMLCSVCGDLRISEIVDAPNWVVSFHFPRVVFD